MKFAGILFDLDGTLINTSPLIIASFQHTFQTAYGRMLPEEAISRYFGEPLRTAMEVLGEPGDADRLIEIYRAFNLEHHDRLATSFEGVEQVLQTLDNAGVAMGVVTSKTEKTAWRGLRLFHLDGIYPACCRHGINSAAQAASGASGKRLVPFRSAGFVLFDGRRQPRRYCQRSCCRPENRRSFMDVGTLGKSCGIQAGSCAANNQ